MKGNLVICIGARDPILDQKVVTLAIDVYVKYILIKNHTHL